MVRVAVIGTGSMGQNHVRVYSEIAEIVGISDINEEVGRRIAQRFNTKYYRDYKKLLKEDIEAITVATPTNMHFKVARDAINRGIHVLVEKPLASNLREAKALVDLANDAGVVLATGHIERHNPAIKFTYNAIKEGRFGRPICLTAKRVSNFPARVRDVGVIMDLGIHDIDITRYLAMAKVRSVYAIAGRYRHKKFEDHANILLEFDNDISAHIEVNWLTPMKVRKLYITCEESYMQVNYMEQSVIVSTQRPPSQLDYANLYNIPWELDRREFNLKKQEPLKNELMDFLNAVKHGGEPLVTGYDGYNVLKIALAAIKSYQKRRKVEIQEE